MELPVPTLPLIRTKLAPPRIASAAIERHALLELLTTRQSSRVHVLVGPAGSGKTSVLVQWRRKLLDAGARVAWYSAGVDDDDLRVAAYLVQSLQQAGLTIEPDGLQDFLRSGGSAWQHLLASLVNDCDDAGHETYLVIDDFQHLTSFAVMQLLNRWVALAPPTLHFVLATRVSPPLNLARLRAEGQLVEIGFGQLKFDMDETRRFVEAQGLSRLDSAQLENLHGVTDGWAAGLQLLTFSIRHDGKAGEVLERPGMLSMKQEQALDEYLAQTVIGLLEPAEVDFLTKISICRRFNRALSEAVSGDARAGERLFKFESENLFLLRIETADDEPWYRFHPLFASFLGKRLRQHGGEWRRLHGAAARWFAGHDFQTEALHHASRSGEGALFVDLIERYSRRLINGGHYVEYLRWCQAAPAERIRERLAVLLDLAMAQISCNRLLDFERTVESIRQHPGIEAASAQMELQLLNAYYAMRTDDPAGQRAAIKAAEAFAPEPHSSAGLMLTAMRCHELAYSGEYTAARDTTRRRFQAGGGRPVVPLVDFWSGFSALLDGRPEIACDQLRMVIRAGQQKTGVDSGVSGFVYGYLMEALYQLDRIDEARTLLEQQFDLVQAVGMPDAIVYAHRVRALIERFDGDHASAVRTLLDLEERGVRFRLDRLVAWSLHDQIRLAIDVQEMERAEELVRRIAYVAKPWLHEQRNVRSEIGMAAALALAEYAVAFCPDEHRTKGFVEDAVQRARTERRVAAEVRGQLLQVRLLSWLGDREAAIDLLKKQIASTRPFGIRRVFADLVAPIREHLTALCVGCNDQATDWACGLMQTASLHEDEATHRAFGGRFVGDITLSEKLLTVREREVLALLGRALSTKSIARELGLSPGTVKWHLRNIYGKLGAFSKEDALTKAREPVSNESGMR